MIQRRIVLRIALAAAILSVAGWHILGFSFDTTPRKRRNLPFTARA